MRLTKQQVNYLVSQVIDSIKEKENKDFQKRLIEFKKTKPELEFKKIKTAIKKLNLELSSLGKSFNISVSENWSSKRVIFSDTVCRDSYELQRNITNELENRIIQAQLNQEGINIDELIKELTKKFE